MLKFLSGKFYSNATAHQPKDDKAKEMRERAKSEETQPAPPA